MLKYSTGKNYDSNAWSWLTLLINKCIRVFGTRSNQSSDVFTISQIWCNQRTNNLKTCQSTSCGSDLPISSLFWNCAISIVLRPYSQNFHVSEVWSSTLGQTSDPRVEWKRGFKIKDAWWLVSFNNAHEPSGLYSIRKLAWVQENRFGDKLDSTVAFAN